ncbi:calcium channel [Coprinopsis marcescibilis]|uniref:Calcium channel n=1 Tax=Coprinopsis marcescibilis TaxID=230819 RepID=A0A5C3KKS1_COPMA|nr:calcium channel [Coprinopsis marcescibilis]
MNLKTLGVLPTTLLVLLDALLTSAQRQLPLNTVVPGTSNNRQSFTIPAGEKLQLSVAICSRNSQLRFRLSGPNLPNPVEIPLTNGWGKFGPETLSGATLQIEGSGSFEVGLSDGERPLHELQETKDLPFFGDTTANQAILFSPPFSAPPLLKPQFPNYTMHPVDIDQSSPPSSFPDYNLSLFPTTNDNNYPHTSCFLPGQSQIGTGALTSEESQWLRDEDGWRTQYLIRGLTPSTNYTAYVIESSKVFGPIYFVTKSAGFPCHLAANLPFCPRVAYSVPLGAPPGGADAYTGATLPAPLREPLRSYITNFTISLGRLACGREIYSPLVECIDCQREYRKWLCAVSLPRCSEPSPQNPDAITEIPAEPTATGLSASKDSNQQVLSALIPVQSSAPRRNSDFPQFGSDYQMLLPCIETCTAVDRNCPPFLGFKCPSSNFNGFASYGIGYIDGADGDQNAGLTGEAQDRYGNVWCASG